MEGRMTVDASHKGPRHPKPISGSRAREAPAQGLGQGVGMSKAACKCQIFSIGRYQSRAVHLQHREQCLCRH